MAETSRFWDGTTVGDATLAPYDAATEFAQVDMAVSGALAATDQSFVFIGNPEGTLTVTGATSPVSMAAGQALVYGSWYHNDAAINITIPTPGGSTRIDRIVLRKDWTLQTIRVTRIAGVEGTGTPPALTQVVGSQWDERLFQVSITTLGAITLTDERVYRPNAPLLFAGNSGGNHPQSTQLIYSPYGSVTQIASQEFINEVQVIRPFQALSIYGWAQASGGGNLGGVGQSVTFTLRKNEADTAMTCAVLTGGQKNSDLAHPINYTLADRLSIGVTTSATTGNVWAIVSVSGIYLA